MLDKGKQTVEGHVLESSKLPPIIELVVEAALNGNIHHGAGEDVSASCEQSVPCRLVLEMPNSQASRL